MIVVVSSPVILLVLVFVFVNSSALRVDQRTSQSNVRGQRYSGVFRANMLSKSFESREHAHVARTHAALVVLVVLVRGEIRVEFEKERPTETPAEIAVEMSIG